MLNWSHIIITCMSHQEGVNFYILYLNTGIPNYFITFSMKLILNLFEYGISKIENNRKNLINIQI